MSACRKGISDRILRGFAKGVPELTSLSARSIVWYNIIQEKRSNFFTAFDLPFGIIGLLTKANCEKINIPKPDGC
jgi:hypothetical protein